MKAVLWMVPAAVVMLLFVLLLGLQRDTRSSTEQAARSARRLELVTAMQLGLASASEAGQNALQARSESEAKTFAESARAAEADVERARRELEQLLRPSSQEQERLSAFGPSFEEFKRINGEIVSLAAMNTNRKAAELAFGPAAAAVAEANGALSRLGDEKARSSDAAAILRLVLVAETSALEIETLLPPHIAEESDPAMDKLEASMAAADSRVRGALDRLSTYPSLKQSTEMATAVAAYARFSATRKEILQLSRANTNVRSSAISVTERRSIMVRCQDSLGALKQTILEDARDSVGRERRVSPR